jgi:hypothetical protein
MKHQRTYYQEYSYLPKYPDKWIVEYLDNNGNLKSQEFNDIDSALDFEEELYKMSDEGILFC